MANLFSRNYPKNDSQIEYGIGLRYETGGAEYIADLEYTIGEANSPKGDRKLDVIQGSLYVNKYIINDKSARRHPTNLFYDYFPK